MKLFFTTLTIIFISFGANASSITVENLYKRCKPFQNNGYTFEGLTLPQKWEARICKDVLSSLALKGTASCHMLNILRKNQEITNKQFVRLAKLTANAPSIGNPVITSFLKYAENNPNDWGLRVPVITMKFLSSDFPCKIKE